MICCNDFDYCQRYAFIQTKTFSNMEISNSDVIIEALPIVVLVCGTNERNVTQTDVVTL
jgi:hypothetical protein